jgi:(1->4)-alpha-D-glucan 1-alpha-D-glucosylmutase
MKCTAPGIPDIYQGTELWVLSLVDPDNRRPVDFSERRRLLSQLKGRTGPEILSELHTGLPKLFVILKALEVRRRFPEAFGENGSYRALDVNGEKAAHGIAFIRGESCITIAPRLLIGLDNDWQETFVRLPGQTWENVLTGEKWEGGDVRLDALLARFPVALLVKT